MHNSTNLPVENQGAKNKLFDAFYTKPLKIIRNKNIDTFIFMYT